MTQLEATYNRFISNSIMDKSLATSENNLSPNNEGSNKRREPPDVQYLPRKKLMMKKTQGNYKDRSLGKYQHNSLGEAVVLVNPSVPKILPSHVALEDSTSRSMMPETATYPSLLQSGSSGSFIFPETFNLAANMGLAAATNVMSYPVLPPIDADDLDSDQYHEIMQGLLQAIHNQNRIMEECRNILTSIHRAIVPFQPLPVNVVPPTSPPQLPLNLSNQQPSNIAKDSSSTNLDKPPLNNAIVPETIVPGLSSENGIGQTISTSTLLPSSSVSSFSNTINALNFNMNSMMTKHSCMGFPDQPTPASKTTQTSQSKEPEKPAVFGPDGEFSSAYLRYVHGKSSTATSFANVLMKEVFTLEERISSNCNGVMGKKALEPNRLDKIKRAVRRFYTDTEEEFQDMWKKCRKSIDSTNRNLKFVIMKKPNI